MEHTSGEEVYKRSDGKLPVIELFGPTIQGEGALIGMRSHFIRFGGCPYRCKWCDSMHAVDPQQVKANARWLDNDTIVNEILTLNRSPWITLTGGDPVMWNLARLTAILRFHDFKLNVETEGALWRDWLPQVHVVTVSPKGPSSGMEKRVDWALLQQYAGLRKYQVAVYFKIVCFGPDDVFFAKEVARRFPDYGLYLSVGTPEKQVGETFQGVTDNILEGLRALAHDVLRDPDLADAIVLPQMHALIWGRSLGR